MLNDIVSDLFSEASAASDVVQDPCLVTVANQVIQLHNLQTGSTGTPSQSGQQGVGLCAAVTPLNVAIFLSQNPWVLPAGLIAVVGLFVSIGYHTGKKHGSKA